MSYRLVFGQLGRLLIVLSVTLAALAAWGAVDAWLLDHPRSRMAVLAMLASSGIGLIAGGALWWYTRGPVRMVGRREAMLLVLTSWIVGGLLGALPYRLWATMDPQAPADHVFGRFINCWFESISALTTTGSTVLSDIEALPRELLLWRAVMQWLGGLGIVVLFVAVLPALGVGGKKIFQIEASKISTGGTHPRIADTARTLWFAYLALTTAQVLIMRGLGVDLFSAVCDSMSTISTGGFSVRNLSTAGYDSPAVEWVVIVFMTLGGVNFAIYYQLATGQLRRIWRDSELRLYIGLLVGLSIAVWFTLLGQTLIGLDGAPIDAGPLQKLRYAVFNLTSLNSTCGVATADFDLWPDLTKLLMYGGTFIGGCAGSTGGGMKVMRLMIILKVIVSEMERAFRPNLVRPASLGTVSIDSEMKTAALGYVTAFALVLLSGTLLLLLSEWQSGAGFQTALTAAMATLCTAGPGLGGAGPTENFAWFNDGSKMILSGLMIIGRLEMFAVFVLLFPRYWRQH